MGIIGGLIPKPPDEEDIPGGPFTEAERKLLRRYLRDERRATWAWGLFQEFRGMAGWRNYCALYLFGPLDKSGLKDFKTKRRRLMTKHLFAFALALLAGVPGYFIFLDRVPPYVELNAIAVTEVVPPGGKFKMVLVGIVNRHCYGEIS